MYVSTERVLAAFFAVASAIAWLSARILMNLGAPESPLQAVYVEGFSRTLGEASVLLIAAATLFGAYAFSSAFYQFVEDISTRIGEYLRTCSLSRYALISFSATAAFLFLLNAPGILYGTFLIDDYKMYEIATGQGVWEFFFTPINDHVIPLFWIELKTLFFFTGPNPPLLNFPLFFPAIIAIGGAAVLLRMLGFGPLTLFVLLGTFASTTVVGHQLYGFYAVAPYIQVLAIFVLSLICFVKSQSRISWHPDQKASFSSEKQAGARDMPEGMMSARRSFVAENGAFGAGGRFETGSTAQQSLRFTRTYVTLSLVLLALSLLMESGAVWTPAAFVLFICSFHVLHFSTWDIRAALKAHAWVLVATFVIALSYAAYLIVLPHFATKSFIGFKDLPLSFNTILELYRVLTEGTLLSLIAPRLGLVVSQPRFAAFIILWHIGVFVLFLAFAALVIYALRKGTMRMRVLVPCFTLVVLGTALLVAIARPSSNPAAFYRDQNLLFPLFFLALALAVFAHEWVKSAAQETGRRARTALIIGLLVIVFVSQHTFSFYKEQYLDDIMFNRSLIGHMRDTLTPALNDLSSRRPEPLTVPSLTALFLQDGTYHQLHELSDFSTFLGIRNVAWLPVNFGPYHASTSPVFIEALKEDVRLREWYLANGEMRENCVAEPFGKDAKALPSGEPLRLAASLDTARTHVLYIDLEARNAPEKIFMDFSFGNDFNTAGTRGYVRLDQDTKTTDMPERGYTCSIDLNELPAFALSPKVSNFTLTITTPGEYRLAT